VRPTPPFAHAGDGHRDVSEAVAHAATTAGGSAARGRSGRALARNTIAACRNERCKNNCFTEMRSGSEEGSYVRLMDGCITQLCIRKKKKRRGGGGVEGESARER